jgi:hypothetical protein
LGSLYLYECSFVSSSQRLEENGGLNIHIDGVDEKGYKFL